jgi:3-isopropylmalate/(R)-2-methylmalate dehydratase small subunit
VFAATFGYDPSDPRETVTGSIPQSLAMMNAQQSEHAPQSLRRFGFEAFVGGSFAEIFAGNCTALGLPAVVLAPADLDALMNAVSARPEQTVTVNVRARTVTCDVGSFAAQIPDGTREQLLEGTWNATAVLLEAGDAIERAANTLPYVSGYAR